MANEGIMALPGGMDMPAEEAQNQQPISVSSADSYDAAQTALGMVNPEGQAAVKEAIRENIQDLQLTPDQLDVLIQVFEYVSQNPGDYQNLVQKMVEEGALDEGDMPEEYDPEFIGTMLAVLQEMRQMQGQGAMEPLDMSPVVEGLQPIGMAEGGLADVASYLASKGRGGDSILAHITPEEAAMLKSRGGAGTINPATGLPEFKGGPIGAVVNAVKSVVKSVVNVTKQVLKSPVGRILGTIALATVLGPTAIGATLGSAGTAALASGTVTLASGGSLKDALISGAMGYVGGGGTIMGTNPMTAVGKYLPGLAGSALNTGLSTGIIGAGIGKLGGMSTQDALRMGLMSGATAGAMQGARNSGLIAEGRVTKEDILRAQGGEGTPAQGTGRYAGINDVGPTSAPGPIGTASDLISPVEVTGTAQAGRFIPDVPQGMSNYPQVMAYRAGQENDLVRLANLQDTYGDRITGRYSYATPGRVDTSPIPTAEPLGRFAAPMEPASTGAATAPAAPAGGFPGITPDSQADFYRSIGIRPESVSGPSPSSMSNIQIERNVLGMTGIGDTARQLGAGAKDLYNEYLSPSRPGLPSDAGLLRKYGPLMGAGLAATAAFGGTKSSPANQNPVFNRNYTGTDYMRDNPGQFSGGLDLGYTRPDQPRSPIVETPSYASIPVGQPGVVMPGGITQSPAGVAQPYNVSGLYGVPLIYGPNGQLQRLAKGGQPQPTYFPRKNGPINGPGTGTSDDIPAMLSDGEFVFTAKAVRNAGGGSRRKGAARMYKLMKKLEGGAV